jgi:hypothetical protein
VSEYSRHISRFDGQWIGRYGDDCVSSSSIFVVVGWVNRHRVRNNEIPLDIWHAQQLHWRVRPAEISGRHTYATAV